MRLSLIIPTFQRQREIISVCVDILRNWDVGDVEWIVVNDGMSPDFLEFLSDDNRIKVLHHSCNLGRDAAIRSGVSYASGDWCAVLDDDDTINFESLNSVLDVLMTIEAGTIVVLPMMTSRQEEHDAVFSAGSWLRLFENPNLSYLSIKNFAAVNTDFKEFVPTKLLKKSIFRGSFRGKRVPYSLYLLRAFNLSRKKVFLHRYFGRKTFLTDGMTANKWAYRLDGADALATYYWEKIVEYFRIRFFCRDFWLSIFKLCIAMVFKPFWIFR